MVSLQSISSNPVDDYINANFIANPYTGEKNVFIATQGPIPASINNFWQMVWNQAITVIVMLCGLEEHGRVVSSHQVSCHVYWPDNNLSQSTIVAGKFKLNLGKVTKPNKFYWIREIQMIVALF